ncbi:hypothetical protein YC2023_005340 [Brassica napus]
MGQLIRVSSGDWTKGPDGIWRFEVAPSEEEHYILANRNDKIPGVMSLVREELGIGENTPMVLSYHLPRSLRPPVGCTAPPNYVLTTQDLRFLLTLQEWTKEVELCVTFGALNVAHYQFLRRESFTIGDRTFLSDGMTEEDTVAAILEMVGEDEFDFSEPGLAEVFDQENLVLVYRFSLEIEKARSMFGGHNNVSYEGRQKPDDEDVEGNNITESHETPMATEFRKEQDCPISPDGYHRPGTPHHSYVESENDDGRQSSDYDRPQTGGDEDCNDFINLDLEDDHITPINQPSVVDVGESSTGSTPNSFTNNYFHMHNDVYNENHLDNDHRWYQRCSSLETDPGAESFVLRATQANSINIDLTVEENSVQLEESNVDDRSGYQSQATHTVIGGMMKARFAGNGGGPRPNDIRQAMEGDHDVHISYWKAWRSREIALDQSKGSCGASYNLLPRYLDKLVFSNPGSITDVHTEYAEGFGAYKLSEFYTSFNEIKRVNASCAEYLIGIGFEHWARSHFEGNRYNIMTSNVAETWNSVLREAREYPILSLIEYIRAKLMDWFATRREIDGEGSHFLTPRVQEIVTSNFERSGVFGVTCIRNGEYEVRDKGGESFHVNLNDKCCTCHEFQALLIPCTHAIAAATRVKVRVDSLVRDCYSLETYKTAYASIIYPVGEEERIEILSNDSTNELDDINPPSSRRPPGRPKKTRILSRGEYQTRGPRKRTVCGRCKRPGHNRATCKMAI